MSGDFLFAVHLWAEGSWLTRFDPTLQSACGREEAPLRNCTVCLAQSPDTADNCIQCGSDLAVHSATAVALRQLKSNDRVSRVRLIVADDACPACRAAEGEFTKDRVPGLPVQGCSHAQGCRCFYQPALEEIYP
jgi:hypothetical protein